MTDDVSTDYPSVYSPQQKTYVRNGEIVDERVYPKGMYRVALAVEYNGAEFHGFQKQSSGVATVQEALEYALSQVAAETITLVCAGRTDAGVHGTNQIVHFDTLSIRPEKAWVMGVNALLPDTVAVKWARNVVPQFHARFSAHARTYRYVICNTPSRPALGYKQLTWERRSIDVDVMRNAAQALVGEHDFTSFRAAQCQAKSPVRTIHYLHIARCGDLVVIEVRANAFLHHMVRNMVGALLAVAVGDKSEDWIAQVLALKDRTQAGVTAKPHGLHLVAVDYPAEFNLPEPVPGPVFFSEGLGGFSEG